MQAEILCLVLCVWVAASCPATDWPQYRGPTHDGVSTDRIKQQWTGSVTNALWRVPLTNGLSSLAVSGGRVFTQFQRKVGGQAKEICVALNATNGALLWTNVLDDANYPGGGVGPDDGPRTTPSVAGDSVFVLTSYLKLYRLAASNGARIWLKDLRALYGGNVINWQNAASPLIEGGLIYVNGNCANTNTLLALRTSDGGLAWASQNEGMTHATPTLATIHGVRQIIFATQSGLVALNPITGALLWRFDYPFDYNTSLAVSPVVDEDLVFCCGAQGYSMGSFAARVDFTGNTWSATQLWANTGVYSTLASHWMTPVASQGFLYGQFGVQASDSASAQLKCVDLQTGEVKWSASNFGRGGTILVDGQILSLTETGFLVLVKTDPTAYTEVARFRAITNYSSSNNRCWNMPAVSDGRVYLRSTAWAAAFNLSVPALKLDAPQPLAANKLRLTIRAADGSAVNSNRLAAMEVRATTNRPLNAAEWTPLTNALVLTNGTVRVDNVDATTPRQFFIVSEPK